jgi:hypothetical protein
MTLRLASKSLRGLAAVAAAAALTGVALFTGAGSASAATLTLNYSCTFPLIGAQTIGVVITGTAPTSAVVGHPTAAFPLSTTVGVPATATEGLNLVGSKTISGTASASSTLNNSPAAPLGITGPLTIPTTTVPASGTFNVVATGTAPSETLTQAGTASITVGNFTTTLTPRNSSGGTTALGTFTVTCTQVAGQNNTLASFPVTAH